MNSEITYDSTSNLDILNTNVGIAININDITAGTKCFSVFFTRFFCSKNNDFIYKYNSGPIIKVVTSFGTKVVRNSQIML
ncbi:hypothetical protein GCM10022397_21570 [Flavivirga jejuensis]